MAGHYIWTIVSRETGQIAATGTQAECAKALGLNPGHFRQNRSYVILAGQDPEYTGSRIWSGQGKPIGQKALTVEERTARKRESKKKRRQAQGAPSTGAEKRTEHKVDRWCKGCIYKMQGNSAADQTCNYQVITGHNRLYKDIPDPAERRLDDPRVCHPGTGCTARIMRNAKC